MIAKHLVGYMTLLFFVVLSSGMPPTEAIVNSIIIYIVFWFSTRMSMEYFIAFIIMASALYIIDLYKKADNKPENDWLDTAQTVLQSLMIISLVVGFVFYMVEKMIEYNDSFSFKTFMLGKPSCRGESPQVSTRQKLDFILKSVSSKK
jgi:hypothetical protein